MVKVLVVDDEKDFCDSISNILNRQGYSVLVANSGLDAIQKVKSEHPQLILLDILMPDMDGIETLKEIRRIDPQAFITMVTVVKDSHTTKETLRLGAVNYMTKPLDLTLLKKSIQVWAAQAEVKQVKENDIVAFDFDEQKCKTVIEVFSKKGYNIKSLEKPEDVQALRDQTSHLAIVRADLLGENSLEIIRSVKRDFAHMPLAVTLKSGLDNKEILAKIKEIGSCEYLSVVFDVEMLLSIICSMFVKTHKDKEVLSQKKLGEERILIIDDDVDTCEYVQRFLGQSGYKVYSLTQPREAIQQIENIKPGLILLDIVMPGMDGLELLGQIRKIFPAILVIMLTGVKDDFICKQAVQSGACDYLVKPFSLDQLKATVLLNSLKIASG
jgi:DNA-binding response OmpR family regulator